MHNVMNLTAVIFPLTQTESNSQDTFWRLSISALELWG